MKKPVIAVDIDDVIADSTESFRLRINELLAVDLKKEHYKIEGDYRGYYERVWSIHGLEGKVSMDDLDNEMMIDQSHVPLLPNALFATSELTNRYEIVLMTSRDRLWKKATLKWLRSLFGDSFLDVHFTGNKHDSESKTKGQLCREVGASWLIDDNLDHCQSAIDEGVEAILFGDYGWHVNVRKGTTRCKDWLAVLEYFDERS